MHTGRPLVNKPVKVQTPLHFDRKAETKVEGNHGIKDATGILLFDAHGDVTQWTICRPIGNVPKTDGKDYVMIQSDHAKSFLDNIKNEVVEHEATNIMNTAQMLYFTTHGLYKKPAGSDAVLWGDTPVAEVWKAASEARSKADKDAKKAYYAAQETAGKFPAGHPNNPGKGKQEKTCPPYKSDLGPVSKFLNKEHEKAYAEAFKGWESSPERQVAKKAAAELLSRDETLGGPDGTTKQTPLPWLRGAPPNTVKSFMAQYLIDPEATKLRIKGKYPSDPHAPAPPPG